MTNPPHQPPEPGQRGPLRATVTLTVDDAHSLGARKVVPTMCRALKAVDGATVRVVAYPGRDHGATDDLLMRVAVVVGDALARFEPVAPAARFLPRECRRDGLGSLVLAGEVLVETGRVHMLHAYGEILPTAKRVAGFEAVLDTIVDEFELDEDLAAAVQRQLAGAA